MSVDVRVYFQEVIGRDPHLQAIQEWLDANQIWHQWSCTKTSCAEGWHTDITILDDKQAMLFKLTWGGR